MDTLKNSLPPVTITQLLRIEHPKGNVFHGMKVSDVGFTGFGEAYFTTILPGQIKGWKQHTVMTMNIIVPLGMVRFHIHNANTGQTTNYQIGAANYQRLTIPPGYWVAFHGLETDINLILNIASVEHNPAEAINVPLETYPLEAK